MKKILALLCLTALLLGIAGCAPKDAQAAPIAATTLPVYEFTSRICDGTGLKVTRLVTESISCLHDYSLNVTQVKAAEAADVIVQSGAGLEDFMHDLLSGKDTIDASQGVSFLEMGHRHSHDADSHHHTEDPHIWLSPENAKVMSKNICTGLSQKYPEQKQTFEANLQKLLADLDALQAYGSEALKNLKCRELITFHDGFSYFAEAFGLTILKSVEEESGSEASAAELQEMVNIVKSHKLPAIFVEANGSTSAANVIQAETGVSVHTLSMAMSGDSYLNAMRQNIDTIKEALG